MCDALGNPTGFYLTPGQAHDRRGADVFLPEMKAHTLIADMASDADERVIDPLAESREHCCYPAKIKQKQQTPL